MSKFGSVFRHPGDVFFFAVQIGINIYGEDDLRADLHRVITTAGAVESPSDKRAFYKNVVALLLRNQMSFEYGHWDYIDTSDDATAEFETWVNEIESSMATEEMETTDNPYDVERISVEKTYVVVSLLFVVERTGATASVYQRIEQHVEDEFLEPATLSDLLDAVLHLDFEYCAGDAAFIIPGTAEDGISWEDIHSEGWNYLQPVMGSM